MEEYAVQSAFTYEQASFANKYLSHGKIVNKTSWLVRMRVDWAGEPDICHSFDVRCSLCDGFPFSLEFVQGFSISLGLVCQMTSCKRWRGQRVRFRQHNVLVIAVSGEILVAKSIGSMNTVKMDRCTSGFNCDCRGF